MDMTDKTRPVPDNAWPFPVEPDPIPDPAPLIETLESFNRENSDNWQGWDGPDSKPEPVWETVRETQWQAETNNADIMDTGGLPQLPLTEMGWVGIAGMVLALIGKGVGILRSVGVTMPLDKKRPDGQRRVVFGKGHIQTCPNCAKEIKV